MMLPSGTLTFLFTDVEGSTRLWDRDADAMRESILEHDLIVQEAAERRGGAVFKKWGDQVCAVFVRADAAIAAALDAQIRFQRDCTTSPRPFPVRIALCTGFAREADGDYLGPTVNRTARILSVGYGGQILLSEATRDLARDSLPSGSTLLDLGAHQLRDLERSERLFQLVHDSLRREFPPLRSLSAFKHNLPIQLTTLVGRQAEVQAVEDLLAKHRLVTLYGSGGCGKTRLSLQVGAEVVDGFPDGVWLVELSNANDAAQANHALASALGLHEVGTQHMGQVIVQHLRERRALLILDNCEHLVVDCAKQALELLRACPEIKLLATSREVLGVPGEVTWRVPSLPVPAPVNRASAADKASLLRNDSVRLFAERGAEAAPGFSVGPNNVGSIAWIAWRLDGIPLALELAAARVKSLTVDQICEKLREHFSILVGPRTSLPRHKTLQATMDWSYLLLEERERALLSQLTVFSGGWTLDAAEVICMPGGQYDQDPFRIEDVADLLSRLEDKSLINVTRQAQDARYNMLQMVREYAGQRLSDQETGMLSSRHLEYYLGVAEEAAANIPGPQQADWLSRLDVEHDNLRAALEYAKHDSEAGESGLRLAGSLARYWHIRGYFSEGRRHLAALIALAVKGPYSRGLAAAHNGLGMLAWSQGDEATARTSYDISLRAWRALGNEHQAAWVLNNLGLVIMDQGAFDEARAVFTESIELRRRLHDTAGEALSLMNLGILSRHQKRFAEALELYNQSLSRFRELGDTGGEAKVLNNLVDVFFQQGDTRAAVQMQLSSLSLFEGLGDKRGIAFAHRNLGDVWLAQGNVSEAFRSYAAAGLLAHEIGIPYVLVRSLLGIGRIGLSLGRAADVARILDFVASIERELVPSQRGEYQQERQDLEAGLLRAADTAPARPEPSRSKGDIGDELELFLKELNWVPT